MTPAGFLARETGMPVFTCQVLLSDFEQRPFGEFGTVLLKDNEIHLVLHTRPQASTMRLVRELYGPLLKKYGTVVTSCSKFRQTSEFVERLGFTKVGEDDLRTYYEIDHIPFTKRA